MTAPAVVDVLAVIETAADRMEYPTAAGPREWKRSHEDLREARAAIAELIEADREYDEALAAHRDLNRRIAEGGWIEVEFDALRKAGTRFVAARIRRDDALAKVGGAS